MSATRTWFERFKLAALSVEAGPFTAVDIDRGEVRVVFAEHRGLQTKIRKLLTLPIPPEIDSADPKALGAFLGKSLRGSSMRGSGLVLCVPRGSVVLQPLRLPPVADPGELPGMVRFQVEKELAFGPDEAVIDFAVEAHYDAENAKGADEGLAVLVAAVKRPVVEHYVAIAKAARLKLLALSLKPYADTACLAACLAKEPGGAAGCLALIHLGAQEAEINVVADGALVFSRSLGVRTPEPEADVPPASAAATPAAAASGPASGVSALSPAAAKLAQAAAKLKTAAAPAGKGPAPAPASASATVAAPATPSDAHVEAIVSESTRTLKSYQAVQRQRRIERVLIAGGAGSEEAVAKGLQARLGLPVTLLNPAAALGLRDADGRASAYTAALGLALGFRRPAALPFDFLNPKRPPVKRDYARIRRIALISAAAVAAALVFVSAAVSLWKKEAQAVAIEKRIAKLQIDNARVLALTRRVRAIDAWAASPRWIDHFALLSACFPSAAEVHINGLRTNSDGSLTFTVKARSETVLTELGRRLREAGYDYKPGQISTHEDPLGYNLSADNVKLLLTPKVKIDLATLTAPPRPADDISAETPREKFPRRSGMRRR